MPEKLRLRSVILYEVPIDCSRQAVRAACCGCVRKTFGCATRREEIGIHWSCQEVRWTKCVGAESSRICVEKCCPSQAGSRYSNGVGAVTGEGEAPGRATQSNGVRRCGRERYTTHTHESRQRRKPPIMDLHLRHGESLLLLKCRIVRYLKQQLLQAIFTFGCQTLREIFR